MVEVVEVVKKKEESLGGQNRSARWRGSNFMPASFGSLWGC